MADEAFDPVQAGAVAVQEPAQFDPVSAGAVPIKEEEPSFLQKAGHALVQGVEKMLPSFKEAYPQATLEQALIPFPIQQAQQGIQLGQEAYEGIKAPLGSQSQLNAAADIGLAFAPLLLPELPRVFKGFRPSLAETFHGVPETPTPVADAAEAAQVAPAVEKSVAEPVPTEPQVAAANVEAAPITQEPQGFPASQEPFPSISQSAEEQRRVASEQTPPIREAISLDELRLMRERNELQMQNDISQRMTGGTHPAVDERIGQIETQLNDIANRELQQKGGGELPSATQEGQVPESNIPEYQGNGEGRPPAETSGGGIAVPSTEVTGQEAVAPPAAETPPSPAVAEPVAIVKTAPEPVRPPEVKSLTPDSLPDEVGPNVKGFDTTYGPGEIKAGESVNPDDLFRQGKADLAGGKDPYALASRARTGDVSPREIGLLAAEHDRLLTEAANAEGTPEYPEKYQQAKDFAQNMLKPAGTKFHQLGMGLQIKAPVDFSNLTGFRQAFEERFNKEMTPVQAEAFGKMSKDIATAKAEDSTELGRTADRVQQRFKGVKNISFEEAVKGMNDAIATALKDCNL